MKLEPYGLGIINKPSPRKTLLKDPASGASLIACGTVAQLVAPGGTGKTQALVQLALSIASGQPWLGAYQPSVLPGHVYYGSAEETKEEMHRRFANTCDVLCLDESVGNYIWCQDLTEADTNLIRQVDMPGIRGERQRLYDQTEFAHKLYEDLLTEAVRHGWQERYVNEDDFSGFLWRLIILEPAVSFMGLHAETDNAAGNAFIRACKRLTQLPGNPTVMLAHHARKSSPGAASDQGASRGSSSITDGVRWQANLDKVYDKGKVVSDRALFSVVKWNYGPVPEPLDLQRHQHGVLLPYED